MNDLGQQNWKADFALADDLLIERVETFALRSRLPRRFAGSVYSMDNRCTIVTRVQTRGGVTGEAYSGDTDIEQPTIISIIHDELVPRLRNCTAADPEGAWRAMAPAAANILRERSLALQAIACVDSALWDAFAKAVGLPLHRLWGSLTNRLPVSVIGGYYHLSAKQIAEEAEGFVARGFGGIKFKVGGGTPADDAARVRIVRETVGPDISLMVDANQGYDRTAAVEFARRVAEYDIRWFEEPCTWTNDRNCMRDVRMQTGIPVCAGQSETTLTGLRDLMVGSAIDVSNFDASWAGGPTIWRKAAGLAAAFGIELGHHEEPHIASHLLAAVPDATFVECFSEERDPFFWHLSDLSSGISNGHYSLPERPGLGIEFDWDYVAQNTADRHASAP